VFLVFHDRAAGYSIRYPEGWTQQGGGGDVTFRDKNNLVHIVVARGSVPSAASVASQLSGLKRTAPTLTFNAPQLVQLGSSNVVKARYKTESAPDPVTGKRVTLLVDRYELSRNGRVAVVDLGTPEGVDNVDAYRMMIESFHLR
jgi:PsbP